MPFDPDFADDFTFTPERFVARGEIDEDFEDAFGVFTEATFDADDGPYAGMEDAAFEMDLFGDC